jgi:CheY-like chemotaxis protein
MPEQILVVEDNDNLRYDLQKEVFLAAPHSRVIAVRNEFEAEQHIEGMPFDLVITDIKLDEADGTEIGGLRVLEMVHRKYQATPVIVVTAFGKGEISGDENGIANIISVEEMARRMGAFACISRPDPSRDYLDVIRETVISALEHRRGFPPETEKG